MSSHYTFSFSPKSPYLSNNFSDVHSEQQSFLPYVEYSYLGYQEPSPKPVNVVVPVLHKSYRTVYPDGDCKSSLSPLNPCPPSGVQFYSANSSIRKSNSSLIMPNLLTFLKSGNSRQNTLSASSKSLATFEEDTIESPKPLIRKCNTSVSLSSSIPVHTTVKTKNPNKSFLRRIASSKSVVFSSVDSNSNVPSYSTSNLSRKASISSLRIPDNGLTTLPENNEGLCSRCTSEASLGPSRLSYGVEEYVHCKMCLGDYPVKDMYQLQQCHCRFCSYCMKMYIMVKIEDGDAIIQCPDSDCDCNGEATIQDVEALVSEEAFEFFLKLRLSAEVENDSGKVWCPFPGCETVVILPEPYTYGLPKDISCPNCKVPFCSVCRSSWHPGKPCIKSEIKISSKIKRCPKCDIPIERDAGCAQMQCKKCKHVFCWYCLKSLEDDFLLRHYDKGDCKNKLGHSRASVIWHRAQVITIFAALGLFMVLGFPFLLMATPCMICPKVFKKCWACCKGEQKQSKSPVDFL